MTSQWPRATIAVFRCSNPAVESNNTTRLITLLRCLIRRAISRSLPPDVFIRPHASELSAPSENPQAHRTAKKG